MRKAEIVTLAVAALLNGTIAVDAFVDAPEQTIQSHFGVEIDYGTIDRIGREFEFELAQVKIEKGKRAPGNRIRRPSDSPGRLNPLAPGTGMPTIHGPTIGSWTGCLTCT